MRRFVAALAAAVLTFAANATPAAAGHSWNDYHWGRQGNPFTLKLGDNVSGLWDGMLVKASSDWSQSTVLDTTIVAGGTKPKACRPTLGRVEVCSASWNNSGWLGLAQIWIYSDSHIAQGVVKNNDYYFGSSSYQYNNTAEMQHVICQEIGHTFGLGHTSEDGSSQNTCMDYYHNTSDSDMTSTRPNPHDYAQLETIYAHLDGRTTVGSSAGVSAFVVSGADENGTPFGASPARGSWYAQPLGRGSFLLTHIYWLGR